MRFCSAVLEESRIVSSKKCCNAWLVVVNAHKLFCEEYHRRFLYFGSKSFTHFEHEFLNCFILLDPGAASRHDRMFVVKVYRKIETSPWAHTLTEPVTEAFELAASD